VWTRGTNDARAARVAFVQGTVTAQAKGTSLPDQSEAQVLTARNDVAADFSHVLALQQQPFPATASMEEQLTWAVAMTWSWDWTSNPAVVPLGQAPPGLIRSVAQMNL
jgi:hypothetical protein